MSDYIKREDAMAEFATNGSVTVYGIDTCKAIISRLQLVPSADVVEVGKWCDMREYILEMQADENGHNEFFRIIKLDDELKERIANEIENAILYGKRTDT